MIGLIKILPAPYAIAVGAVVSTKSESNHDGLPPLPSVETGVVVGQLSPWLVVVDFPSGRAVITTTQLDLG